MFNQRGQAFSVFELMIAAIVAVAILFVLLPILGGIITPTGDAKTNIGNTLASIRTGGTADTPIFKLEKGTLIKSEHFTSKGLDKCSINFDRGKFSESVVTVANGEESDCSGSFLYTGVGTVNARAKVICETTPTSLQDTVNKLEGAGSIEMPQFDYWTSCGKDGDYDVCCLVILQKA